MTSQAQMKYDQTFFDRLTEGSLASARDVMPIVFDLAPAQNVVDFGCGRGTWLKACLENGVDTVLGLDGDYVDQETLLIERQSFRAADLRKPIRLERGFDLAICLEVGEHLPASSARSLVESLAAAAPIVLFSAALPGQGGTSHINEQWPPYWERLFAEQGMRKYDVLRPLLWDHPSVEPWYKQNIYIYSKYMMDNLESLGRFEPEFTLVSTDVMSHNTFQWSSRALKFLPLLRRFHSLLSRFT